MAPAQAPKFTIERFDRATSIDQIVASLKWNGGVVVKNFLNSTEVAEYDALATSLLDKTQFQHEWDTTKRITRLPLHMPDLIERVLSDELMLRVCDEMLTVKHTSWFGERKFDVEDKPVVQMTTAFAIAPGTGAQDLHRDDGLYHNRNPAIHPSEYETGRDKAISFFIAGRKTMKANGATNFIPGSHLQDTMTAPKMEDAIPAELEAGDAFFMCASAYHGGGCNSTTDQWRLVYGVFMMQAILRQEENIYLAVPPEAIKKFSKPVQKRLGYDTCQNLLGWIDYSSPMDVILGTGEKKEMFLRYDGDGKDEKRDSVVIEQREVADITV